MSIDSFDSFELTPINLMGQIGLGEKYGLVVLRKTEDGKTILVVSGASPGQADTRDNYQY